MSNLFQISWMNGHWLIASSAWDFRQSKRQNCKSCLAGWLQHIPAMVIMSFSSFSFSSSNRQGALICRPQFVYELCVQLQHETMSEHFRNSHTIDASTIISLTNWQGTALSLSLWMSLVQLFEIVHLGSKHWTKTRTVIFPNEDNKHSHGTDKKKK